MRLLAPGRRDLSLLVAASVLQGVVVIAQAWAVAALVVAAVGGDSLGPSGVLVVGAFVARAMLAIAVDVLAARAAGAISTSMRREVLARAVELGPGWLAGRSRGGLVVLATRGISAIEPYVTRYLPALLVAAVLPAMTVVAIGFFDWSSALIVVATLPLVPIFGALVGVATRDRARAQWRQLDALAGHFLDVVTGLATLVAFRRATAQIPSIRRITHRYRRATLGTLRIAFAAAAALELIATISVALVAVWIGLRLAAGGLDLRTALVVLLLAPEAYWPLRRLGTEFHAAAEGVAALEEVRAVLDAPAPADGRVELGSGDPLESLPIVLDHASVTYAGRTEPALQPLTATIAPRSVVAVSGPSGSGKSTLLAVLAGQLLLSSGRASIGGVDTADASREALRRQVAWLGQRPWIVTGTIADNVRVGRPDATDEQVWSALREVGLAELAQSRPGGLGSSVGQSGTALSAGQRARLALARVVIARRPVVLLDEPTAHLDPDTEQDMLAVVRRLAAHSTVVIVAHRQAVLDIADQVLEVVRPPSLVCPVDGAASPSTWQTSPVNGQSAPSTSETAPPEPPGPPGVLRRAAGPFLGALSSASGVALTATAGWLIVRAPERPPVLALMVAIVAVRTFGLARPILRYAERLASHDVALRELAERRTRLFERLIPLAPGALGPRRGDLLASVVDDVDAYVDRALRVRAPIMAAGLVGAASVVAVGFASIAGAVAIASLLAVAAGTCGYARRATSAGQSAIGQRAVVSALATELLEGARDIAQWGALTSRLDAIATADRQAAEAARSLATRLSIARASIIVAAGAGMVWMAHTVDGPSPAMVALILLVPLGLLDILAPLADAGVASARCAAAISRLDALAVVKPVSHDPVDPIRLGQSDAPTLVVDELAAGWADEDALKEVSFSAAPGARVGVVGPTGSGKSTLAAVLLRFLDRRAGGVCVDSVDSVDSVDIERAGADDVRRVIGLVDDDPHIFGSTLAENVRLARPDASDDDVERAVRSARLGQWLDRLPDGLATRLGDGGADVSGGERARIAVARSFLADQRILVLDEPTAHLDSATADELMSELLASDRRRTLIWITHRLDEIDRLDAVVELTARGAALKSRVSSAADR